MALPPFDEDTGYLPEGEFPASLKEIESRFGTESFRRREIFSGLVFVIERLRSFGVETIWIDGSFVTDKQRPGDVDVAYEIPADADPSSWGLLAPNVRPELFKLQRVDLLPGRHFRDYFMRDQDDRPKGIVRLEEDDDANDSE